MLARGSGASSSVGEEVGIGMGVGVEPYYSVPVGSAGCTGQHWSQPTSPTPTHTSRQPPNLYQHVHKDDDSEYHYQKNKKIGITFVKNLEKLKSFLRLIFWLLYEKQK